jgi:hypothetical protein
MYQKSTYAKQDPYLQINCYMDMDSMEITKTKAIKKYEENSYLLGRIFELESDLEKQNSNPKEIESKQKQENNNKICEGLDIASFFEEKMDEGDYDTEEKIDSAIREFSKIYEENKWEDKTLLNKLNEVYNNYKKEEDYLEKERADFEKSMKKYEELISSFKNLKSNIELKDVIELVKQCEKEGFLQDKTKKEFDKFVEDYKNNKIKEDEYNNEMIVENITLSSNEEELPFTQDEKIISYHL